MTKSRWVAEERGVALLVVIAAFSAMTIFLSSFLAGVNRQLDTHRQEENRLHAANLAHTGIQKAISSLLLSPKGYAGEERTPFDAGYFTVEAETNGDTTRVISTGIIEADGHIQAEATRIVDVIIRDGGAVSVVPVSQGRPYS